MNAWTIILILTAACELLGLAYAIVINRELRDNLIQTKREVKQLEVQKAQLWERLAQKEQELVSLRKDYAEKKQALDYVCEANRRYSK